MRFTSAGLECMGVLMCNSYVLWFGLGAIGQVNPKGGAIALGHPLGCTGARQIATLLHELRRTNKRYGVVSMCIGTGMGAAAVFENEAAR